MSANGVYYCTNENLAAIVNSMDVNEADDIIAICGSGDQAFAMLEKANSVVAVDNHKPQVEYAISRAEALRAGDYDGFFPELGFRLGPKRYLKNGNLLAKVLPMKSRLEKIRLRLDKLDIRYVSDFMDEVKERKFSKAYLSNMLGYNGESNAEVRWFVEKLAGKLREPGLIYAIYTPGLDGVKGIEKIKLPTMIARCREFIGSANWMPTVYRRKA
ncbi:MAG: hypothetical protein WC852_07440 [Candidatus Nanoarchaeia archaeon]|jgi:hypothetical protein